MVHYELHVLLKASQLGLQTSDSGPTGVLPLHLFESVGLKPLHLRLDLLAFLGQSAVFETYFGLFLVDLLKLVFEFLDSCFVVAYLVSHASLVRVQTLHS